MMVRVSEWTFIVNSGGIAEAIAFVPLQGQERFFYQRSFGKRASICHKPKHEQSIGRKRK
jgi:hypothetical protein